ncbi:Phage head-tail joining protein [Halobacillus karajensis]|uniref:head-tail adaptor protein n=1 Tax=Halobacillus karajensis TaxID=195088 RepID=UPI0008A7D859|nr:head-tail adaptor protein [Halobacillus karajensis]SEH78402.1 Phage head-tail joining protein [Halobacillus karajensis]
MKPFKYKPPRTHTGELRTPVSFFESEANEGPMPGESKGETLYSCFAKVDEVWMKDIEVAKANGTLSDVTLTIRDPLSTFRPTNKHHVTIDHSHYQGKTYRIKEVQPDMQNRQFVRVIAGVSE